MGMRLPEDFGERVAWHPCDMMVGDAISWRIILKAGYRPIGREELDRRGTWSRYEYRLAASQTFSEGERNVYAWGCSSPSAKGFHRFTARGPTTARETGTDCVGDPLLLTARLFPLRKQNRNGTATVKDGPLLPTEVGKFLHDLNSHEFVLTDSPRVAAICQSYRVPWYPSGDLKSLEWKDLLGLLELEAPPESDFYGDCVEWGEKAILVSEPNLLKLAMAFPLKLAPAFLATLRA